jgi:DNA repair exonuclease SbcCD ATPase subunit
VHEFATGFSSAEALAGQTDSFYLQQESLRAFLATRSDDERFSALSQMVGAKALSDLVAAFDSASRAWSKSVSKESGDVDRLRDAVDQISADVLSVERSLRSARALGSAALDEWTARVQTFLEGESSDESGHRAFSPVELAALLEQDVEIQRAARDELDRLRAEQGVLQDRIASGPQVDSFMDREIEVLERNLRGLEAARVQADADVEDARQKFQSAQTRAEELRALADLALRHVSDHCPTCGQDVDPDVLTARLLESASAGEPGGAAGEGQLLADANLARDAVLAASRSAALQLEQARAQLDEQRRAEAQRARDVEKLARVRSEADRIERDAISAGARGMPRESEDAALRMDDWISTASVLLREYRGLEPVLSLASTEQRLASLLEEQARRLAEYERAREVLATRERTQAHAEALLRGLKRDSENFLNERLRAIQPILDQLYAAIDPHPTLRGMSLETRNWYGKNRLSPVLVDTAADLKVDDPGRTLSTSQANALAVTLFLAFNLGLRPTRVNAVVLDDPLQNLDDVHLLGLVDLLRRVQSHRQVIVTTHDPAFADLIGRKMRPTEHGERLNIIRLETWDREGPRVVNEHLEVDPTPLKLAIS